MLGDGALGGPRGIKMRTGSLGGGGYEMVSEARKRRIDLRWLTCSVRISHCEIQEGTEGLALTLVYLNTWLPAVGIHCLRGL